MATETKTFYPGAYLTSDYNFASIDNETNPVGKGSSNTTYAMIGLVSGSFSKTWVYWPFDLSAIPNNATIDSVSCYAKGKTTNTNSSYTPKRTMQLYAGTTPKGSAVDFGYNATVLSLSGGTWTRDELRECRLKLYVERGSSNSYIYIYFYGADLTVTYTYQSEKFMLKLGGAWHDVSRVFKKVNGIWVEQTDLANVIEDGVRYQNGGEIVPPNPVVNIVGTGNSSNCYATINGVKYTAGAKVSVEPGTVITLVMKGSSSDMPGAVFVDSATQPAKSGTNVTYNHTVTNNSVIQFMYTAIGGTYNGVANILTGVDGNVAAFSATVDGSTYFTYEFAFGTGMTWAEFCGSRFNIPFGATVSGNQIGWSDGSYLADVILTDVIVAGKTYTRTGL